MDVATSNALRLERLLEFIKADPSNLTLISDAALTALDEGRPGEATKLLDLYADHAPLPPTLVNAAGLAALQEHRADDALAIFGSLLTSRPDDGALRFNLAWAHFLKGDGARAAALIDDSALQATTRASAVKVQALHMAGLLDEALREGQRLAECAPQDEALLGALAAVAMDLERPELAREFGQRASSTADGLATLGSLDLADGKLDEAERMFEGALEARYNSGRALIGKGLVLMARNEPAAAAEWLHKGANVFGDHLGSWIAAGWAEFAAGDYEKSRLTFEYALALDDTFAESHGALAVLDVIAKDLDSARRRTEVAMRLDRHCFSGALARSLIEDAGGGSAAAVRIRKQALNAPIDGTGRTLAQAVIALTAKPIPIDW